MEPHSGNGRLNFIKKQIGEAIKKAERSGEVDGVCSAHKDSVEVQVLSVRIGEMVLDETIEMRDEITSGMFETREMMKSEVNSLKSLMERHLGERKRSNALLKWGSIAFGSGGAAWFLIALIQLWKK